MDIGERLRTEAPSYVLIGDAAIEIDRLREALQLILDSQLLIGPTVLHGAMRRVASTALQQKENK